LFKEYISVNTLHEGDDDFDDEMMTTTTENVQKTAILSMAHILQKVLMLKYRTFNIGNTIICDTNSNCRIDPTLHSLETWFVSGIKM
jgi:hypothetical protein